MTIQQAVSQLVQYGLQTGLIQPEDSVYLTNQLLDLFQLSDWQPPETPASSAPLEEILHTMLDYASAHGLLPDNSVAGRDQFDTRIMGLLTPRPSEVISRFRTLYQQSPQAATDFYFKFSQDSDYIRRYRICKDQKWTVDTEYGEIDITINLSKPEKDPKAIAAARNAPPSSYPACLLCRENEGYAGHLNHPARQNHRLIPLTLAGQPYFLQYSPYVYYNEHCIVLNQQHCPMKIDRSAFARLLDFVAQFPHYFLGSNADLPIVGGSILSHDHFQGGRYRFAMQKAPLETALFSFGNGVTGGIVKWPMSVLRLFSEDREALLDTAEQVLKAWRSYSDASVQIFAETNGEPHNTITPIASLHQEAGSNQFQLDLVLRNNLTTEQYPLGLYHPHPEHHHIKKENIGLIEVMGLAILPARLKEEIEEMKQYLLTRESCPPEIEKHLDWLHQICAKYPHLCLEEASLDKLLRQEIGLTFVQILEQAGVFKRTPEGQQAFIRFLQHAFPSLSFQ